MQTDQAPPAESIEAFTDNLRRMAVAGLFGAAIFLVEAGTAELLLRADRHCRAIRAANWAFLARGCQPEAVGWFLQGLSRGLVGALRPDLPPFLGVAAMAVAMGSIAVVLARTPLRRAVPTYFGLQVVLAAGFGLLGFLIFYMG
jgi:hypothetical protein